MSDAFFDVIIRRVSDGVERRHRVHEAYVVDYDGSCEDSTFWWTDGNGACDCNLAQTFAAIAGEPDPQQSCGMTAYTLVGFETPDGVRHEP